MLIKINHISVDNLIFRLSYLDNFCIKKIIDLAVTTSKILCNTSLFFSFRKHYKNLHAQDVQDLANKVKT